MSPSAVYDKGASGFYGAETDLMWAILSMVFLPMETFSREFVKQEKTAIKLAGTA